MHECHQALHGFAVRRQSPMHSRYAQCGLSEEPCWQAGQWELAVALFEKLSDSDVAPDVPIFNSMIAACAHGGGYARARALFDAMPAHGCAPDAVTFANLIRAYKKGGQWCVVELMSRHSWTAVWDKNASCRRHLIRARSSASHTGQSCTRWTLGGPRHACTRPVFAAVPPCLLGSQPVLALDYNSD